MEQIQSFLDRVMLLQLRFSRPGNVHMMDNTEYAQSHEADAKAIRISKVLFTKHNFPELHQINQHERQIRAWVETRALPNPFGHGLYMIPSDLAQEVDDQLEIFRIERSRMIGRLEEVYYTRMEDAMREHGDLATPEDYLEWAEFVSAFDMRMHYRVLRGDSGLYQLSNEGKKRAEEALHQEIVETREMVQEGLRKGFLELISSISESLQINKDGSRRRISTSKIDQLLEWIDLFSSRDILSDEKLSEQVDKVRKLVGMGINAEALRSNAALRSTTLQEFRAIAKTVQESLHQPRRRIST